MVGRMKGLKSSLEITCEVNIAQIDRLSSGSEHFRTIICEYLKGEKRLYHIDSDYAFFQSSFLSS